MRRKIIGGLVLAAAAVLALQLTHGARGQSSSRSGRLTHAQFQSAFWGYLTEGRSAYKKWGPFPGKEPAIYEGQSPHGAYLRLYANSAARGNPDNLPHGSIVVKENYGKDRQTLMAVTVMYRAKGYDPEHNDWYWIKYSPNGKTALTPPDKGSKPIAGRFASCINCHSDADGDDFSFAND